MSDTQNITDSTVYTKMSMEQVKYPHTGHDTFITQPIQLVIVVASLGSACLLLGIIYLYLLHLGESRSSFMARADRREVMSNGMLSRDTPNTPSTHIYLKFYAAGDKMRKTSQAVNIFNGKIEKNRKNSKK